MPHSSSFTSLHFFPPGLLLPSPRSHGSPRRFALAALAAAAAAAAARAQRLYVRLKLLHLQHANTTEAGLQTVLSGFVPSRPGSQHATPPFGCSKGTHTHTHTRVTPLPCLRFQLCYRVGDPVGAGALQAGKQREAGDDVHHVPGGGPWGRGPPASCMPAAVVYPLPPGCCVAMNVHPGPVLVSQSVTRPSIQACSSPHLCHHCRVCAVAQQAFGGELRGGGRGRAGKVGRQRNSHGAAQDRTGVHSTAPSVGGSSLSSPACPPVQGNHPPRTCLILDSRSRSLKRSCVGHRAGRGVRAYACLSTRTHTARQSRDTMRAPACAAPSFSHRRPALALSGSPPFPAPPPCARPTAAHRL